jgi:shikimate kinase/3-dehydroquinate synthase
LAPLSKALVFIGFMGAGKSTAAAEVAGELGLELLDTDRLLEARLGHSIAREWELHGQEAFRAHERELVRELLAQAGPGVVIALGGGAVLSPQVREALAPHVTVLLELDPASAWERVRQQDGERPLARDPEAFAALHAERRALYEGLADAILPSERPGVALRALPALRMLAAVLGMAAPSETPDGGDRGADRGGAQRGRMLWATSASGEYPVLVGGGLLRAVARPGCWPLERAASRAFCVTDETVGELYAARLGELAGLVAIAPGESAKTLATAERVWRELALAGMTRADHVVALGGGVVGDLAGFCAATYQRGVPVVQVPSTLVAQVDSAYGGKTGVDLPEAKNYVGAYHQPAAVIVDPQTLSTLPAAELNAGWVEVLKTALIAGGELWQRAQSEAPGSVPDERTILDCARLKLAVVAEDERDGGRRQVLNLGHTVGHAIETATAYARYRHGEAVGLGLLAALRLSGQDDLRGRVRELLLARGLPVALEGNASVEQIVAAVAHDKKRIGAHTPFVLVHAPGDVRIGCEVAETDLRAAVFELA